ncbi:structural protein [Bivalve RNA virus G1]|uniref:structural protein n=1 Tax=Bivalve RNA virus G1 TaxID=1926967 RepID=UPI00092DD3A5|nr:structural protein [Bivalve RNA virus G1]APJ38005.1 structural protein [Bivalve RNA virus G1]
MSPVDGDGSVDTTRGNLLTDIQDAESSVPMPSTATTMALNDVTKHEIKSILERPVKLGTFQWTANQTAVPITLSKVDYNAENVNVLKKFNFPQDIFNNSPITVDKLQNYQYFKSDLEVEVKWNAQPFLQGALMLEYNPYYDRISKFRRIGTQFLASSTTNPRAIQTLENSTSFKITCPYANIYDLFDLENEENQFGTVFLKVISPLRGPDSTASVSYTVFARFINPEFYTPTQKDVLSNTRDVHEVTRLQKRGFDVTKIEIPGVRTAGTEYNVHNNGEDVTFVAQGRREPVATSSTGEEAVRGPVSQAAKGIALVSDALSGIPLLGQACSMVSWVARTAQHTAASFGWSKPISILQQEKRVIKPATTMLHTEGTDDSTTLALIQDNGIDGSSFIPEDKDEMCLKYVRGRPSYFTRKNVPSTTFTNGALLHKWEVSPLTSYSFGTGADSQTLYLSGFSFSSIAFSTQWRGTINYDIMVVKSNYHKARFAVVFLPETLLADVPENIGNLLTTNYNVICDFKGNQEDPGNVNFRVAVPFISNTPWRNTVAYDSFGNIDPNTISTITGSCAIYALNALSFPASVSPSVDFLVAHSAGEDYCTGRELLNLTPGFTSKAGIPPLPGFDETGEFVAEGMVGPIYHPIDQNLLVPSHKSTNVNAQTVGESFLSLRSLIKRFCPFIFINTNINFSSFRSRFFVENDATGERKLDLGTVQTPLPVTPFYLTSFLYRFWNGSSSVKILPATPFDVCSAYVSVESDTDGYKVNGAGDATSQPIFEQNQFCSGMFEVRTPYYKVVRGDVVGNTGEPIFGDIRTNLRVMNNSGLGDTSSTRSVYEAAGDDFSFYFLVGPPPMKSLRPNRPVIPSVPPPVVTLNVSTLNGTRVPFSTAYGLLGGVNNITSSPAITVTGKYYGIAVANSNEVSQVPAPSFTATYTDGSTAVISFNDCGIIRDGASESLVWEFPEGVTLNVAATISSIQSAFAGNILRVFTYSPTTS